MKGRQCKDFINILILPSQRKSFKSHHDIPFPPCAFMYKTELLCTWRDDGIVKPEIEFLPMAIAERRNIVAVGLTFILFSQIVRLWIKNTVFLFYYEIAEIETFSTSW